MRKRKEAMSQVGKAAGDTVNEGEYSVMIRKCSSYADIRSRGSSVRSEEGGGVSDSLSVRGN